MFRRVLFRSNGAFPLPASRRYRAGQQHTVRLGNGDWRAGVKHHSTVRSTPAIGGFQDGSGYPDPVTPVLLSTSSVFPEPTSAAFATAAALRYDGVEVMVWTDAVSQDAGALRGLSEHYGVPIRSVHAPCLLVTQRVWSPDPWERLRRACGLADPLAGRGFTGSIAVEVSTRRAASRSDREADLAEALAFARTHLAPSTVDA